MFNILLISILLTGFVYMLFMFVFYKSAFELDSISSYECGFNPGLGARLSFSYRFFLISILFVVFDVEIALLLPVPFVVGNVYMGWYFMMFMMVLVFGLLYEYTWGSLDWLS